ncbi:MAG: S8 family peptidase [Cyclobacteriaceae bacterium]
MMRSSILLFFVCFFSIELIAQSNRYVVYFSDKANNPYSIERPEEFLSARAIARRQKQQIAIDESDLPVNPTYIDSVNLLGIKVWYTSKWMNLGLVQVPPNLAVKLQEQSFVDSVALVAEGEKLTLAKSSFDWPTSFTTPSSNRDSDKQNELLGVGPMHEAGFKGQDMLIALFDGGYEGTNISSAFQHIFENEQLVDYHDYVSYGDDIFVYDDHGTSVFSTTGGLLDGQYAGTAYEADYALYVTEEGGSEFRIEEYNWLIAAERADSLGVDVINTSVGYSTGFTNDSMDYTYEDLDGSTAVITIAANYAVDKGMIVVCSAGNEGNDPWQFVTAPADGPNVLAVGSITSNQNLSSFSSLGPTTDGRIKPDVVAMGSQVTIVNSGGNFSSGGGTSYSAPQIAGFAATLWQAKPESTNLEIIADIKASGNRASLPDNEFGYGLPNFDRALNGTILAISDIIAGKINVFPNPFSGDFVIIEVDKSLGNGPVTIALMDAQGRKIKEETIIPEKNKKIEYTTGNIPQGAYILSFVGQRVNKTVRLLKI